MEHSVSDISDKTWFDRSKPHLNIGTIGDSGHGKTALTAALCRYLEVSTGRILDQLNQNGNTVAPLMTEYETENRHFVHIDCPGLSSYGKSTINAISQLDAAILVINAEEGIQEQTREHVMLAGHFEIPLIVFLTHSETAGLVARTALIIRIRRLLKQYDLKSLGIAFEELPSDLFTDTIVGLEPLVALLDETPIPNRVWDGPFRMPVSKVIRIPGTGFVATGRVDSGTVRQIDEVEICGRGETLRTTVTGVESCRKLLAEGMAGDQASLLLRGIGGKEIRKGQVVGTPGSLKLVSQFRGNIRTTEFSDRCPELSHNYRFKRMFQLQFFFDGAGNMGRIETSGQVLEDGTSRSILLDTPYPIEVGSRFLIRHGRTTVASGVVSKIVSG